MNETTTLHNFRSLEPSDFAAVVPCEACISDPTRMAQSVGDYVAVYCPHRQAGMHYTCSGLFTVLCPVSEAEFAGVLVGLETRLAQVAAARQAKN